MKVNTQKIAEDIYNVMHADWQQRKEWNERGIDSWSTANGIWFEASEDGMAWYVWMKRDEYSRRVYSKVLPRTRELTKEQIGVLLDNQPWLCI